MNGLTDTLDEAVDWRNKSFPVVPGVTVGTVPDQQWRLLDGDFAFPVLTMRRSALARNLALMAEFCRSEGVELAPHGKTHMSPQLWERQRDHGATAVTVATAAQARVFAQTGATHILIANEVIDRRDLVWIQRTRASGIAITIVIDSEAGLFAAETAVAADPEAGPIDVLIELGYPGGRAGMRTADDAVALARRVHASPGAVLRGVEGYEGVMPGAEDGVRRQAVRRYLDGVVSVLAVLGREGLIAGTPIASFGGSMYPDVVADALRTSSRARGVPLRILLRSGCYLTHDHGLYAATTAALHGAMLEPALELWARVLSRPEPTLAILGAGRRDCPHDAGLPIALRRRADGIDSELTGVRVTDVNDQHLYASLEGPDVLEVGDLVCLGISHPCTAFDKWRLIPEVDDDYRVVGAIRTYF